MSSERPNPVAKAAEASALPRTMRARVGATTDPVPEGKELAAAPEHRMHIFPAGHDVERTHPRVAEDLGLPPGEADKLQGAGSGAHPAHPSGPQQAGMDYRGSATSANKLMDSRHHGADFGAPSHNKHLNSVYRAPDK
jgi:hypothetical protein